MADTLPHITLDVWHRVIEDEYLNDYVKSGGSSVKVVACSDENANEAIARVRESALNRGYYYAHLDPSKRMAGKRPDLHRIDQFFFAATREVNWKDWAAMQARRYLDHAGIHVTDGRALSDLEGIANDNERDPQDLLSQYQSELATPQMRDSRLSLEFRAAVTGLTRSLLIPDAMSPTTEDVLLGWFAGKSAPGAASALKKVQIFERINMGNARSMLTSFCRWLPQTGHAGLVVTFDCRPYEYKKVPKGQRQAEQLRQVRAAVARGASSEEIAEIAAEQNIAEPDLNYSDAAYMQMLTLIRRFIDEIDWFERFMLVIITSPNFYKDKSIDPTVKRCYYDYDALQTRIGQEVHNSRNANPAAALVHLGGKE